tara:strand:+ start:401 stop:787 length:387 start_codon:yes stop_codon:yes gene_type:complete
MNVLKNIIFFLLSLFFTLNVLAHHSGEMFDDDVTVTLSGVVKEFRYINPHSWLIVDIDNDDGSTTTWGFEAEGPQDLMAGGVRKNDLPPGTRITISGHPMKDGRPAAVWTALTREDGTFFNWRTPGQD